MEPREADIETPPSLGAVSLGAAALAALACWPMLVTGDVFLFLDSRGYLETGGDILAFVEAMLTPVGEGGGGLAGGGDGGPSFLRSFAYSTFAAAASGHGGALLLAFAQGWMACVAALSLLPRDALRPGAWPFALPLMLTTLPWFAVFVMPDLFAAVILAYGALLWRVFDHLGRAHQLLLVALASAAGLAHYGNPPLAAGLFALVLAGRLVQRRLGLGILLAAALPVLMGPLANYAASSVALDEPSSAPKRLPILLARSIEDGPAAWYLAEACPNGEDLAICAAFDGEVPDDMTEFLWSDGGIKSLSEAEMSAIRAEEPRLLWAAFRAYPLAQAHSLSRNALRQTWSVGLAKIDPAPDLGAEPRVDASVLSMRLVDGFDRLVDWTTLAGALALVPLAWRNRARWPPVAIVGAGLLLNALVFGGLSAPDDRYQARVAWLLPFLALGFAAADLGRARRGHSHACGAEPAPASPAKTDAGVHR